ncbi:hypothetical protein QUB48_18110 [Microcoleus sp. ARI1-A5]
MYNTRAPDSTQRKNAFYKNEMHPSASSIEDGRDSNFTLKFSFGNTPGLILIETIL